MPGEASLDATGAHAARLAVLFHLPFPIFLCSILWNSVPIVRRRSEALPGNACTLRHRSQSVCVDITLRIGSVAATRISPGLGAVAANSIAHRRPADARADVNCVRCGSTADGSFVLAPAENSSRAAGTSRRRTRIQTGPYSAEKPKGKTFAVGDHAPGNCSAHVKLRFRAVERAPPCERPGQTLLQHAR